MLDCDAQEACDLLLVGGADMSVRCLVPSMAILALISDDQSLVERLHRREVYLDVGIAAKPRFLGRMSKFVLYEWSKRCKTVRYGLTLSSLSISLAFTLSSLTATASPFQLPLQTSPNVPKAIACGPSNSTPDKMRLLGKRPELRASRTSVPRSRRRICVDKSCLSKNYGYS